VPPGPRTRANRPLAPVPGGAGDPELVPATGLFSAPEPIEARPFSRTEAERVVTEAAAETLRTRGEPATFDLLLAEVLVALDRTGHLRRFALASDRDRGDDLSSTDEEPTSRPTASPPAPPDGPADPVDRLLALIREELSRPTQRRLTETAGGRFWLADRVDRDAAAAPLADRLEWTTYSLLSTGGPLSEAAFRQRVGALFRGPDLPDDDIVAACLDSYRSRASTSGHLVTNDDLAARTHEHAELIALLAETGHRLGLDVWISATEQHRRLGARTLGEWLEPAERTAFLGGIAGGRIEAIEQVDAAWYARGRLAFLFEVEWTAILGEVLLGRHALIPPDERVVRFLVVPPERAELVRAKLDASPVVAAAIEAQNWHVLKWNHLRTFASLEHPTLESLEPFVGLDPSVERAGEQLPLFGPLPPIAPSPVSRTDGEPRAARSVATSADPAPNGPDAATAR
jgi:hypothetical protein